MAVHGKPPHAREKYAATGQGAGAIRHSSRGGTASYVKIITQCVAEVKRTKSQSCKTIHCAVCKQGGFQDGSLVSPLGGR